MGKCCSAQKSKSHRENDYIQKSVSENQAGQKGGNQRNQNAVANQMSNSQNIQSAQQSESNKDQLQVQAQQNIQNSNQYIHSQSQQILVQPQLVGINLKVDQDKLERFFKQKYIESQQSILCPICACQYEQEKICHLNCSHSFCDSCFYEFIKIQIKDSKVKNDQMNCPSGQCKQYIHPNQIVYILQLNNDQEILKKYAQLSVKVADTQENEKQNTCPTCQKTFITYGPEEGVTCPYCQTNYCPKCFKQPH